MNVKLAGTLEITHKHLFCSHLPQAPTLSTSCTSGRTWSSRSPPLRARGLYFGHRCVVRCSCWRLRSRRDLCSSRRRRRPAELQSGSRPPQQGFRQATVVAVVCLLLQGGGFPELQANGFIAGARVHHRPVRVGLRLYIVHLRRWRTLLLVVLHQRSPDGRKR